MPAARAVEGTPPTISAELRPGHTLYMPRRTPHAARTQQTLSGHLTVGIPATTWRIILDRVVGRALDEAGLEEPLPAGYHRDPGLLATGLGARMAEVTRALEKLDAEAEAAGVLERFLSTRPSLLRGALVDLTRMAELDDRALVRRRPGSACELTVREGRLIALLGDRALHMPARCEPAMREIAAAPGDVAVSDLAPHLDEAGRLTLVRRLVREGLLEVVGGA